MEFTQIEVVTIPKSGIGGLEALAGQELVPHQKQAQLAKASTPPTLCVNPK